MGAFQPGQTAEVSKASAVSGIRTFQLKLSTYPWYDKMKLAQNLISATFCA